MHIIIMTTEAINVINSKERCVGRFRERKRKGKICNFIIFSKVKIKN